MRSASSLLEALSANPIFLTLLHRVYKHYGSHVVRREASSGLSPGAWVTVTMATGESLVSAWRKRGLCCARPDHCWCCVSVSRVRCLLRDQDTWHRGSRHHYKTHTMTRSICHPGHSYHFTRQLGDGDCLHISVNKSLMPLHPIS